METVLEAEQHGLRYRFAGSGLESCKRRLLARGESVTLTPKVFDTLVLPVEHVGHAGARHDSSPAAMMGSGP